MSLTRHHRRLVLSLCVLTCLLYIERSTFPLFVKNSPELAHLSKLQHSLLQLSNRGSHLRACPTRN